MIGTGKSGVGRVASGERKAVRRIAARRGDGYPGRNPQAEGSDVRKKSALRPDTTLAPAGDPEGEIYVRGLPACCLRSFKEAALAEAGGRRRLGFECECGRGWRITSSLDERVLDRFVTHAGPRAGGSYPAA